MAELMYHKPTSALPSTPVNHSLMGFGFGLSAGWQAQATSATAPYSSPTPQSSSPYYHHNLHQRSSASPQPAIPRAAQKRRHEDADEERDDSMERSPTPERERKTVRKIVPKRMRTANDSGSQSGSGNEKQEKGQKNESAKNDEVDVGMLLASLPKDSLLPLISSLLASNPQLKSTILSLIPRPPLDAAVQALATASRKLRDAYPYSTSQTVFPSPSFGFGFGFGGAGSSIFTARPPSSSVMQSGFGRPNNSNASSSAPQQHQTDGMRDTYVLSRIRPHIAEFCSTALSYLTYYSLVPSGESSNTQQHPGKDTPLHPSETFTFLSALVGHIVAQPPLAQSSLVSEILPRLVREWMAWVDRVDAHVNKDGGMFGMEVVRGWERTLDEFATAKIEGGNGEFKEIRDKWVARVGWLVGRRGVYAMED